jgi:CBS domain containing-hemolysin-like protein
VVADGYGQIDGVVSTTDIFAAIAGDLAEDEDQASCQRIDAQTIEADATIPLADVTEALGHPPLAISGRYGTLGGYLLFEFGRMPDVGETMERDGLHFTVRSVLASRIDKVHVEVAEDA